MPDDFHLLKTVSVSGGEVTLRIPRRWDVWPHERDEGRWGCYEEERGPETDTGTLWIQVDHFRWQGTGEPPPGPDPHVMAKRSAARRFADDETSLIESEFVDIDNGCRWHYVFDTVEDGEPLRFFYFHFILGHGPNVAVIAINLVLTHAQMNEPDYVVLREVMLREVKAARLEPFVDLEEAAVERQWGELSRINFADKVKIVVPDVFMLDQDEEAALPSPPQRPGGIDVQTDEIALCDADDGAPATIGEAYFVDTLRHYLDERADDASYLRLPDGALAYIAHEAPDGGAPETYEWWNMCMTHGKARIAHVTLRPSATGDGSPPDPAFARYLDGAIRRAEFPDFGAPVTYIH